jgi:hypothetical protein
MTGACGSYNLGGSATIYHSKKLAHVSSDPKELEDMQGIAREVRIDGVDEHRTIDHGPKSSGL